jgi:hypothetical protein
MMDEIIAKQGWTEATVLALLKRFIRQRGLTAGLIGFLKGVAEEENEMAADDFPE